jgi:hypothetical protein
MLRSSKKSANNIEINRGSILLLFSDEDEEIVRSWSNVRNKIEPTPDAKDLPTCENIRALGATFRRNYPVDETPCFESLLLAIDDADGQFAKGAIGPSSCSIKPPL